MSRNTDTIGSQPPARDVIPPVNHFQSINQSIDAKGHWPLTSQYQDNVLTKVLKQLYIVNAKRPTELKSP